MQTQVAHTTAPVWERGAWRQQVSEAMSSQRLRAAPEESALFGIRLPISSHVIHRLF